MALEHLNLDPVRTKNVPIFCPKSNISKICRFYVRSFEEEQESGGGFQRGGAPRSESEINMIAGGNHTIMNAFVVPP